MAIKELQTRIALKYDSYVNWTDETKEGLGANLVLLPGELGICEVPAANGDTHVAPTVLFKVGGAKYTAEDAAAGRGTEGELMKFKHLPWASAKAADVYGWAKKSEADFKTWLSTTAGFATDTEVEALVATERARIAALEAKFGDKDGTIDKQIEALDGRLDVIEGSGEGSVAKALADAKAYTDEREDEIEKAYKKYADDTDAARKEYIDGKVTDLSAVDAGLAGRLDVIEGEAAGSIKKAVADAVTEVKAYTDTAETDAVNAAKAYTNEREVEINKAIAAAEAAAKKDAADNLATAVGTQATVDAAQDAEIAKKLDKTTFEAFNNGTSKTVAAIEADIAAKAGTAKTEAVAAAKTETETQIKAFKEGDFSELNTRVAGIDEAYKAADEALDGRLDTVEAKLANVTNVMDFRGAVEVLPASTEGYQDGDVIVVTGTGDADADKDNTNIGKEFVVSGGKFVEFGNTDANTSAITALQGRMDTAEDDIDDLETVVATKLAEDTFNTWKQNHENDHANKQTVITESINAEKSARETADKAINDKIGTLPTGEGAYTTLVAGIAAAKQAGVDADAKAAGAVGRLDVVEPKVTTLQNIVSGYTDTGSIKAAVDAAANAASVADGKAVAADGKAVDAQTRVGVLETTTVPGVKAIAEDAQTRVAAVEGRMTTAETSITNLQNIVSNGNNTNAKLREDITELQGIVKTGADANVTLRADLKSLQDVVNHSTTGLAATKAIADEAKADAEDAQARVAAIEADYVKATDLVNDHYIFNCGSSTTVVHEKAAN